MNAAKPLPIYAIDVDPERASRVSGCRIYDKQYRKFLESATKTGPFDVRVEGANCLISRPTMST
jgi:hypothetical protein